MTAPFTVDLESVSFVLSDKYEQAVLDYILFETFSHEELRRIYSLKGLSNTVGNSIRYRIGKALNTKLQQTESVARLNSWALEVLEIPENPNRRLRRHARNIDVRILDGEQLRDLVKLPTLDIRGAKSRKDRDLEQSLDALRSLRGDLQDKIVTK